MGSDNPALLYTIGQRVHGGYVVGKDVERGTVAVSRCRKQEAVSAVQFENANWFVTAETQVEAQYRYRGPRITGMIYHTNSAGSFKPETPLSELPAPGQSIVFYRGSEMIGGGIIV